MELCRHFRWDLWLTHVLQLATTESSILHATTAFVALYRQDRPLAWQQYNKAIRVLTVDTVSVNALLVTCLLFTHIEILWGDYKSAFLHIRNGSTLLKEHGVENADLIRLFASLEFHAASYDPAWVPHKFPMPARISSIEDAKMMLDAESLQLRLSTPGPLSMVPAPAPRPLHSWTVNLETFLADHKTDHLRSETITLLRIQHILATIFLSASRTDSEMIYDQFTADFETIVSLAASLSSLKSDLSCYTGVIPALYLTGIKCRQSSIRRQAVEWLSAARIREGLWDSFLAAKVVEEVIAIEEAGIEEDVVPAEARVFHTWLTFSETETWSATLKLESARCGKITKRVVW